MKRTLLKTFYVLLIAISSPLAVVYAQQLYVATDGNDGNSGALGFPKATIQAAINDASTGDIINVAAGVYTLAASVEVNKAVTITGVAGTVITGTGSGGSKALIEINSPNVTIEGLTFEIAQTGNSMIGISTTDSDNFNNLTITENTFKGMDSQNPNPLQRYTWDSYAIKLGRGFTTVNNEITVVKNTITYGAPLAPQLFGRGIYAYNVYGKIGGSVPEANTISAAYALHGGEIGGGVGNNFEFSHNIVLYGLVSVVGAEIGEHKISNNSIGQGVNDLAIASQVVRFVEVKGSRTAGANIEISNNTIQNYAHFAVFVQRSNNVTIKDNTFSPYQDAANTSFASIAFSSKEGTSGAQLAATSENLTVVGNTFNSNGSNTNGQGVVFLNHNASVSVQPLINGKIGGVGGAKNTFSAQLAQYIVLDATASGATDGNPQYNVLYDITQDGTNKTNILPFNSGVDAAFNIFGGVDSETANVPTLESIKSKILDNEDNGVLGSVNIVPIVLPVDLVSFTAQAATRGAILKWATASETNNAGFEIEKSIDGKSFFVIDSRKGQGNSTAISSYEFLDVSFKQSAYYRLVQVDAGGKRKIYDDLTKFVKGLDNSLSVIAYPNPVTTKLYVTIGAINKENVKVLLSDLTGKTLKVKTADSSQPIELDVAGIATGSYILQVIKDSGSVSKKILKL